MSPKVATPRHVRLTPGEVEYLSEVYCSLGVWTEAEALKALGEQRLKELIRWQVLGRQDSLLGPVYQLLAVGRLVVFGTVDNAASFSAQLDAAYVRLCLRELKWDAISETNVFSKGWQRYAPSRHFQEVYTDSGLALVGGKITDGGYSSAAIKNIGQKLRSNALYHGIQLIILTPSPKRGQQAADQFQNFIRLQHHLPSDSAKCGDTRFRRMKAAQRSAAEAGPFLTPAQAVELSKTVDAPPSRTLQILQLPRRERVQEAINALQSDGVITRQQLHTHYRLEPTDLPGFWLTSTMVRPVAKSDGLEVQTDILVAHKRMTRLSDAQLLHRINLAAMRYQASIAPDSNRWIVNPKSALTYEEPDALYGDGSGKIVAVESDIGHYTYDRIDDKLGTFRDRGFVGILYGVPSTKRKLGIEQRFSREHRLIVVRTAWWEEV